VYIASTFCRTEYHCHLRLSQFVCLFVRLITPKNRADFYEIKRINRDYGWEKIIKLRSDSGIITRCAVLTVTGLVNGTWPPHRIHTPWPITKKLWSQMVTWWAPTPVPNMVQIRRWGFWANGWNITPSRKSQKSRYLRNGLTDLYEIWHGDAKRRMQWRKRASEVCAVCIYRRNAVIALVGDIFLSCAILIKWISIRIVTSK